MGSIDRSSPVLGIERRRTPRVGVEFWVQEHCDAGVYYHRVTNLSSDGFFVDKKIPFRVGQEVTIRMDLPGDDQRLEIRSRVIDNYRDHQANFVGTGFQFLELAPDTRRRIDALIQGSPDK